MQARVWKQFSFQPPPDWLTFPDVYEPSLSGVTPGNDFLPASLLLFLLRGDSGENTDAGPLC